MVDHLEVKDFFGKWMGIPLSLQYILSGQLLNEEIKLLNNVMISEISGQKDTLIYDEWNNKKRNYLVAIVILINSKPYPI